MTHDADRPTRSRRTARRRGSGPATAELTTIWWRDIPVQVLARGPGDPVRAELPRRFTRAVDRAAMAAGLAGTDAYLDQWLRRPRPCGPDLQAEVTAEVERLVAAHPRDVLEVLVANGARATADDPAGSDDPADGPAGTDDPAAVADALASGTDHATTATPRPEGPT